MYPAPRESNGAEVLSPSFRAIPCLVLSGRWGRTRREHIHVSVSSNTVSILACSLMFRTNRRVAIVDYRGQIVYHTYVQPTIPVTDYRTATTGIEPQHLHPSKLFPNEAGHSLSAYTIRPLDTAAPFNDVQQRVANLIRGKILIGHTLWHDLSG